MKDRLGCSCGFFAEIGLQHVDEVFGEAFRFVVQTGGDMVGFGFEDQFSRLIGNAVGEIQAGAFDKCRPDFDGEDVVVAGGGLVA